MLNISERIAQTAEHLIEHDAHGYSQPNRYGDGTIEVITYTDGSTATVHGGDYDCSELARVVVNCGLSGYFDTPIRFMTTHNEYNELTSVGFMPISTYDVSRGDILLRDGHTEVYLGDGVCGGARMGDMGIEGIQGDQEGWEVSAHGYNPDDWDMAFTISGDVDTDNGQSEDEMICIIQPNEESRLVYVDGANVHPLAHPDESEAIQEVYRRTHNGAEIPIFKFGTPEAPWATRLFDALNRKM